jgi:Na+/phosphate symporter
MKKKIVNSAAAKEIDSIAKMLGDVLTEIQGAFKKHRLSLKYQQTTTDVTKTLRKSLVTFYEVAEEMSGNEALAVQATAINLSKVFYDILRLSNQVETKVKEEVMFSEAAVGEVEELIRRTAELLPHVADAIRTCNPLIIAHVNKEVDELRANAANTTVFHEDRLCKGACHPKASVIFMQMMQHLQDILWHFKALVTENGIPSL